MTDNRLAQAMTVVEHGGGCAVDNCELVVPSGQSAPLRQMTEPALDDVAAAVVDLVKRRWPTAT
ncbi:hypothetical protein QSJ19_26305 [Gordonia sp. ABSL11-1]|uniref:hypothetical protein n=1 Tax=Gordonia sp. ABSL11-1 TaxID=3053924 RepID=UPI0025735810|nr:hypothetical protein [Gordonia sp. ABSL11-1]MDL9949025.1 hypothetical protein [Gordonia sp. ABSL11-1]